MTATRMQHVVSATLVLLVAAVVSWLSFTQQPAEAFLFPRLISVVFVGLAAWNFVRAAGGFARVGEGLTWPTMRNLAPGLVVMFVYVFFAARGLGFYVSSAIAFLVIYSLYDRASIADLRAWGKRLIVTALFMAVIYGLFALLLKVQTPRGLFF